MTSLSQSLANFRQISKMRKRENAPLAEIKPPNLILFFTKNVAKFNGKFNPGLA